MVTNTNGPKIRRIWDGFCPEEGAIALSPGLNGTKLRGIWGILLPRRGYRIQPRVSTLGNFNLAVRPEAEGA